MSGRSAEPLRSKPSIPTTLIPGSPHALRNCVASETARVLNLYTPGGFIEQITWLGTPATELRLPTPEEQTPAGEDRMSAYLAMSADLNTQRWLRPGEAEDLLADERDAFNPR